jgi:uncharacterized membrane protein
MELSHGRLPFMALAAVDDSDATRSTTPRASRPMEAAMSHLTKIGRILFGVPFVVFGLGHFANASAMAAMVPSWLPGGGELHVYASGALLVLGGAGTILSAVGVAPAKVGALSALVLIGLLATFIAMIHLPLMGSEDPGMQQMGMMGAFKDAGLLGGGLAILGVCVTREK